jgi:hypothetical protein
MSVSCICAYCLKSFQGRHHAQRFCSEAHRIAQGQAEARERKNYRKGLRGGGGRNGQTLNRQLADMPDGRFS